MDFTEEFLLSQTRKQLQSFCKENGIKANSTSAALITALLSLSSGEGSNNKDEQSEVFNLDVIVVEESKQQLENSVHKVDSMILEDVNAIVSENVNAVTSEESKLQHPAWNSVHKKNSQESSASEKRKKSISTPSKRMSQPSIMPKSTKTQEVRQKLMDDNERLHQEALLTRREKAAASKKEPSLLLPSAVAPSEGTEKSISITPVVLVAASKMKPKYQIQSKPSVSVSSGSKSSLLSCSSASKKSVVAASAPLSTTPSKKSGVPDFQKMHDKITSSLKPITEIVHRNEQVSAKMAAALAQAQTLPPPPSTFTAYSGSSITSSGTSLSSGIVSSGTKTAATTFKARTMPNFKKLHSKIPQKAAGAGNSLVDKENVTASCANKASEPKRTSVKGSSTISIKSKHDDRKGNFLKENKDKRADRVSLSRRSGPFSS